ncbi:hypothetical protein [Amycolatopsis sp. NPDC049868]|uniref:hypothetical protein n=1 Tax=Amycolatopsis sp. NPDC049868 TaxID=3363934 RepID=UPI00379CA04E
MLTLEDLGIDVGDGIIRRRVEVTIATTGDCGQLVDDLMDIVSTQQLWRDLANGVYTACVLHALRVPRSGRSGLLSEHMETETVIRANERAAADGAKAALDMIENHVLQAEAALEPLPRSAAAMNLAALPRRYATGVLEAAVLPERRQWLADLRGNRPAAV